MEGAIAAHSMSILSALPAGSRGWSLFAEAIATVNRAIATGLERNRGVLAAFCADHVMHLTLALVVATIALVASRLTARIASLWLVRKTLHRMERLILRAEGERLPTILTRKGLVLVIHR